MEQFHILQVSYINRKYPKAQGRACKLCLELDGTLFCPQLFVIAFQILTKNNPVLIVWLIQEQDHKGLAGSLFLCYHDNIELGSFSKLFLLTLLHFHNLECWLLVCFYLKNQFCNSHILQLVLSLNGYQKEQPAMRAYFQLLRSASVEAILSLQAKKSFSRHLCSFQATFLCSVVTSVTFGSNRSNFENNPKV